MFYIQVNEDVSLKLLQKCHAKELFTTVNDSREYLREWLPWVDNTKQAKDYEPVIEMWLNQFTANDGFQAGIIFKGDIVGMVGFHGIDWANRKTSIGYWLAEKYQGNGIMTDAVKALLDIAFSKYHLNRVEIMCGVENHKSKGIPERLGFQKDGVVRDAEFLYDHFHDCVLYSMLASEWESQSAAIE